jgi:hypothetical protein
MKTSKVTWQKENIEIPLEDESIKSHLAEGKMALKVRWQKENIRSYLTEGQVKSHRAGQPLTLKPLPTRLIYCRPHHTNARLYNHGHELNI